MPNSVAADSQTSSSSEEPVDLRRTSSVEGLIPMDTVAERNSSVEPDAVEVDPGGTPSPVEWLRT